MIGKSTIRCDKISAVVHLAIVFAALIHGRPDRDNRLDSHALQLIHHRFRVRPVSRLKFKLALHCPVEKVDHDRIHRKSALFVFSGNCKDFILVAVAQFALPVSHTIFRHHRSPSGCRRILFLDFKRCISCRNKVVQFFCALCVPLCLVCTKNCRSDCRVVPEKSIASA